MARSSGILLVLGTVVAFFGTGFFSGSGIVGSEIFPTRVRARALASLQRSGTLSSLAPLTIGWVGQIKGLSWAFFSPAAFFCWRNRQHSCRNGRGGVWSKGNFTDADRHQL